MWGCGGGVGADRLESVINVTGESDEGDSVAVGYQSTDSASSLSSSRTACEENKDASEGDIVVFLSGLLDDGELL